MVERNRSNGYAQRGWPRFNKNGGDQCMEGRGRFSCQESRKEEFETSWQRTAGSQEGWKRREEEIRSKGLGNDATAL
jgi:hypothetical protein